VEPVVLQKGSVLMMTTYDNSTNNVRNPNNPPSRDDSGTQSTDEMAELWLQLRARRAPIAQCSAGMTQ
jgi:hypothetical protein